MSTLKINEKLLDTLGKHDYHLACAIETYQTDKDNLYDTYYGVKEYLEKGTTRCCPSSYFVHHILESEQGLICEDCAWCWKCVILRLKELGYLDE